MGEMLMTRPKLRMLPLPPCFLWDMPVWAMLALAMLDLATLVLDTLVWAIMVLDTPVLDTLVSDTPVSDTLVWDTTASPPPPRLSRRSPSTSSSPGDGCVRDPGLVPGVDCASTQTEGLDQI